MFKNRNYNILTIDFRNPELSNKINLLEPIIKEYESYMKYDIEATQIENDVNYYNSVIESLNNQSFNNSQGYAEAIKTLKPNQTVYVSTDQGDYSFKLGENPNNKSLGYMGVQAVKHYSFNNGVGDNALSPVLWVIFPLIQLFSWIFFLNFAIGTFNLLPMKPLDGGLMFETLLSYKLSDKYVNLLTNFSSYLMLIIILVSLVYGIGSALI